MTYALTHYPLGVTSADKTPSSAPDLVATWGSIKDRLRIGFGEYKFADGSLATFHGQRCPMVTSQQAVTILEWLARVGDKMTRVAQAAGRSTTSMTTALARFKTDIVAFRGRAQNTFNGRLPLETCYLFIDAANRYVIAMSAAQYAAFNTGTPLELWTEALNETPGGSALLGIWDAAKLAVGAGGFFLANLGTILKLALIGGVGYVGYRVFKTVRGGEPHE